MFLRALSLVLKKVNQYPLTGRRSRRRRAVVPVVAPRGVIVFRNVLFDAFVFCDQGPLQDDPALLVPLVLLRGELIHPAQLDVAAFAGHVPNNVSAGEHDPVLHVAVVEVDHFVEEEGPAGGPREPRRDEFGSVGEEGVALGATKQFSASDVFQVNPTHAYAIMTLIKYCYCFNYSPVSVDAEKLKMMPTKVETA